MVPGAIIFEGDSAIKKPNTMLHNIDGTFLLTDSSLERNEPVQESIK